MKKTFVSESFLGLPGWAKGLVAVAVVGGVGYIGFKIYKKLSNTDKGQKKEEKSWDKEAEALNKDPKTKATISTQQLQSYANVLQTAMNGMTTNVGAITSVFNALKNDADFAGLTAAFGVRTINSGVYLVPDFTGTLAACLTDELSTSEKNDLNTILAKKGIKYRV